MTTTTLSSGTIGWVALAIGVVGLVATALLVLFFIIGQPFGTLNDICIGITAILTGVLAFMLFPEHHAQSRSLSYLALCAGLFGSFVVLIGSVLVVSGRTGWFLAGLYMAFGYALIGLWLLGLNYSARQNIPWPDSLAIFGLVAGTIMVFGLATFPGIIKRIDAWQDAQWYVNYIGWVGSVGWLILYPIWSILLGQNLFLK